MFNWLEELLEIKYRFKERKREGVVCNSCEILKSQLNLANIEKHELLSRILNPAVKEEPKINTEDLKPISRHTIPWKARQQMLENEDRIKANLIKNAPKADKKLESDLDELERELDIVSKEK